MSVSRKQLVDMFKQPLNDQTRITATGTTIRQIIFNCSRPRFLSYPSMYLVYTDIKIQSYTKKLKYLIYMNITNQNIISVYITNYINIISIVCDLVLVT